MSNYLLAWSFDGVFGASYAQFKTLADLRAWQEKYSVKINAVHKYKDGHFFNVIYEDKRGEEERIKVKKREEQREKEEERRIKLGQDLYVDFVNGHKYF